jgi:hypothetical protein
MTSISGLYREFWLITLAFSADNYQVELTRAEVESLRSEIADADERESQLKARYDSVPCSIQFQCSRRLIDIVCCPRLENIDEVLRYARLCGYLHIRSVCEKPQLHLCLPEIALIPWKLFN